MDRLSQRWLAIFCLLLTWQATGGRADKAATTLKEVVRTDRFGRALPEGAVARLGMLRDKGDAAVQCLAFAQRQGCAWTPCWAAGKAA